MANFVNIPWSRLDTQLLDALLEEFATRDGTDYGEVETTLEQKTAQLRDKLLSANLYLLYDSDSQEWDLVDADSAALLMDGELNHD